MNDPAAPCPHEDREKDAHGRCPACMSRYYALRRAQGVGREFGTPRAPEAVERKRGPDYEAKSAYREWRDKKIADLTEKQGGVCAICGQIDEKGLCLDHDHRCCPPGRACDGCARGALCHGCNMRLGQLESDLAGKSMEYLLRFRGGALGVNEEVRVTSNTGGQKGQKLAAFHLIPPQSLWEVAETFGRGAEKYGDGYNYLKGYAWSLSLSAAYRHLAAFAAGQSRDLETGNHHLACVAWHALVMMDFERLQIGEDDRHP